MKFYMLAFCKVTEQRRVS